VKVTRSDLFLATAPIAIISACWGAMIFFKLSEIATLLGGA